MIINLMDNFINKNIHQTNNNEQKNGLTNNFISNNSINQDLYYNHNHHHYHNHNHNHNHYRLNINHDYQTKQTTTNTIINENVDNYKKINGYCKFNMIKSNGYTNNLTKKSTISSPKTKKQEWQKVLYKHQGVPDNYVPPTFLKELRKNVNLRRFHLMEIIIAASVVTQQIILIVILIMMFIYFNSYENQYDNILFAVVASVTIFLYLFIFISTKFQELIQIKSCLIFLIACFTMSPVLKTLTETISTDTIYAQCTIMTFVHLMFHDYGLDAAIVSQSISLNAIFFASVCLASRLSTNYHAFAFLIFSTDLFVLINQIYKSSKLRIKLLITISLTILILLLIEFTFGLIGFIVSILFFLFINLICPYIFLRMQILKDNIYGPWDEAIIDRDALRFSKNKNLMNGYNHTQQQYSTKAKTTISSAKTTTTTKSSNQS